MRMSRHGAHCTIDERHWSQYTEGEFTSAECRRCEAHLKACAECRAKLRALGDTLRACRQASRLSPPRAVQAAARRRVEALLAREASPRRKRPRA